MPNPVQIILAPSENPKGWDASKSSNSQHAWHLCIKGRLTKPAFWKKKKKKPNALGWGWGAVGQCRPHPLPPLNKLLIAIAQIETEVGKTRRGGRKEKRSTSTCTMRHKPFCTQHLQSFALTSIDLTGSMTLNWGRSKEGGGGGGGIGRWQGGKGPGASVQEAFVT